MERDFKVGDYVRGNDPKRLDYLRVGIVTECGFPGAVRVSFSGTTRLYGIEHLLALAWPTGAVWKALHER